MNILLFAAAAFLIVLLLGPVVIPFLRRLKFGQEIREIGPNWHKNKAGTPTMGGLMFLLAIAIIGFLMAVFRHLDIRAFLLILTAMAFGIIGLIDDYIKVATKRNLGLTSIQKFSLQLLVAVVFVFLLKYYNLIHTQIIFPFIDTPWDMGWLYYPFAVFVILAGVNAVNLTDGLDGLASSITLIVCIVIGYIAYFLGEQLLGTEQTFLTVLSFSVAAMCAGFLVYNHYPAKVFMGDTGSLFLGGFVSCAVIILNIPVFLILIGIIYFIETLSVIIQVISFKLTGKRVFKMSPIHHHFEMCGWSEVKIVLVFSAVTLAAGLIAILSL